LLSTGSAEMQTRKSGTSLGRKKKTTAQVNLKNPSHIDKSLYGVGLTVQVILGVLRDGIL